MTSRSSSAAAGGTGICWLVTDLDGTLVGRDLRIVPRSRRALARFAERGGEVIIATGRSEVSAGRYYTDLGLRTPMILYNGARVVGPHGEILLDRRLGSNWQVLRDRVLPGLGPRTGAVAFVRGEPMVVHDAPVLAEYARRDGIRLRRAEPVGADRPVTKLMIVTDGTPLDEPASAVLAACPELTVVSSEDTYLEILPPGASKGSALRWLAAGAGVDLAEIAAIGDNPNDRDMVLAAGIGAAVGDGHPGVKDAADIVVGGCADGAVADLVDHLAGLGSPRTVPAGS